MGNNPLPDLSKWRKVTGEKTIPQGEQFVEVAYFPDDNRIEATWRLQVEKKFKLSDDEAMVDYYVPPLDLPTESGSIIRKVVAEGEEYWMGERSTTTYYFDYAVLVQEFPDSTIHHWMLYNTKGDTVVRVCPEQIISFNPQ